MLKQSSLFEFMSHNENDSSKMNSNTSTTAPTKAPGKFKFNTKTSAKNVVADSIKNSTSTANKIATSAVHNVSTASNGSDCMIIDDDQHGFSTAKSLLSKENEDDILFEDFDADDLTFTKITTQTKKETSMEDLYAKYGSPKPKSASTLDIFDIDKQLSSNASYVNAIKKLDENMAQLRASPLKKPTTAATTTAGSKFKFNVKSKPPTAIGQSVSPPVVAISSGFGTNLKTMGMSNQSSKTSTALSNTGTFKPSTITSNISSNSTVSNSSSITSYASSFDTPVSNPYKSITPVQSQVENSSKMDNSSP